MQKEIEIAASKKKKAEKVQQMKKVKNLLKQLITKLRTQFSQSQASMEKSKKEEVSKLFDQLQGKPLQAFSNEKKEELKLKVQKQTVIAFGGGRYKTRGVPREKIKKFLKSKKVTVNEVSEYLTSQRCNCCGEVKKVNKIQ